MKSLIPKIKKSVSKFLLSERGSISRRSAIIGGLILAASSLSVRDVSAMGEACSGCCYESDNGGYDCDMCFIESPVSGDFLKATEITTEDEFDMANTLNLYGGDKFHGTFQFLSGTTGKFISLEEDNADTSSHGGGAGDRHCSSTDDYEIKVIGPMLTTCDVSYYNHTNSSSSGSHSNAYAHCNDNNDAFQYLTCSVDTHSNDLTLELSSGVVLKADHMHSMDDLEFTAVVSPWDECKDG